MIPEYNDDGPDDEEDVGEQLACVGCLGPAGRVPILLWRTANDEVRDEWAVCTGCVQAETAKGKTLSQALVDLLARYGVNAGGPMLHNGA